MRQGGVSSTPHDALPVATGWRDRAILVVGAIFIASLQLPGTVALRLSLLALLVALALVDITRLRAVPRPIVIALVLWAALSGLSLVNAINLAYSSREFLNEIVYTSIAFLVFFILAASLRRVLVWRNAFLVATLVLGAVAVAVQLVRPDDIHRGAHGGPGTVATFLIVGLPLLILAGIPAWHGSFSRWLVACGLLVWFTAAWASENRIVWPIALVSSLFMMGMLYRYDGKAAGLARFGRRQWLMVGLILIAFVAAFAVSQVKRVKTTELETAMKRLDRDPRLNIWSAAVQAAKSAPWTGFGVGRGVLSGKLRTESNDPMGWHGHNVLINAIISLGPAGPLVLLFLLGSLIAALVPALRGDDRDRRLLAIAGITVIGAFFLRSMTDDFFYRHNAIMFWSWNGILLGYVTWPGERRIS